MEIKLPNFDFTLQFGKGINNLEQLIDQNIYFMVDPQFYDPRPSVRLEVNGYIENDMCANSHDSDFDRALMIEQHHMLREKILSLGHSVVLGKGQEGQLDGVFTRDPGISFMTVEKDQQTGNIKSVNFSSILANFYHAARQDEVENYREAMLFLSQAIKSRFNVSSSAQFTQPADCYGEGGDFVFLPERDIAIFGHRPQSHIFSPKDGRTDKKFHEYVANAFGLERKIIPVEVANQKFHADVSTKGIGDGHLLLYPHGIAPHSLQLVQENTAREKIIIVSTLDANAYLGNTLPCDRNNVIPPAEVNPKTLKKIEKATDVTVHPVPLSQFVGDGGAGTCLTNVMNYRRNPNEETVLQTLEI